MNKPRKLSVEKIITECDRSMKLMKNMSGSFSYRKDAAIKEYLQELLPLRADYDRLNDFKHSQCAKLLEENGRLRAALNQTAAKIEEQEIYITDQVVQWQAALNDQYHDDRQRHTAAMALAAYRDLGSRMAQLGQFVDNLRMPPEK